MPDSIIDDNGGQVQLNDDQMSKLADTVAARMIEVMKPPVDDKPIVDDKPPVSPIPTGTNNFTAADVASAVKDLMDADKSTNANKVFDTLWKEKYKNTVSKTQGLDEFIKGEDDYGKIREDELNKISDYEERSTALVKLSKSFQEASAGAAGRRPVVNKKVEQKKQEAQTEYQKIVDNQNAGKYKTVADMTNAFWKAFNKETEGLT